MWEIQGFQRDPGAMCSSLTEGPTKTQDEKAFKIVALELEIYKHSITCQVDKLCQIHAELYTETLLLTMHGELLLTFLPTDTRGGP